MACEVPTNVKTFNETRQALRLSKVCLDDHETRILDIETTLGAGGASFGEWHFTFLAIDTAFVI